MNMVETIGRISAPGVVHLFGEYSSLFGGPGLAFAIDLELKLQVTKAPYDFHIVDGYKLDNNRHPYFHYALERYKCTQFLEFKTESQMPSLTGMGNQSALAVCVASQLLELKKRMKAESDPRLLKKKYTNQAQARHAFNLERLVLGPASPLSHAAVLLGGIVFSSDSTEDALWPIDNDTMGKNEPKLYLHSLNEKSDIPFVIGYLKPDAKTQFSRNDPKPLFSDPPRKRKSVIKHHKNKEIPVREPVLEPTNKKLQRLIIKSGFARDNLKEIGQLVNDSVQPILTGDQNKLGTLMMQQQNLLNILGIYPQELKKLAEAAKGKSYGVTIIGTNTDCILALPKEPEMVVTDIVNAGGEAVIVKNIKS